MIEIPISSLLKIPQYHNTIYIIQNIYLHILMCNHSASLREELRPLNKWLAHHPNNIILYSTVNVFSMILSY